MSNTKQWKTIYSDLLKNMKKAGKLNQQIVYFKYIVDLLYDQWYYYDNENTYIVSHFLIPIYRLLDTVLEYFDPRFIDNRSIPIEDVIILLEKVERVLNSKDNMCNSLIPLVKDFMELEKKLTIARDAVQYVFEE